MAITATVRLGRYAPPLSRWAPAIKSHAWRDMASMLGTELGRQVVDAVDARRLPAPQVVVPVPVHWTRRMMRGIDHAGSLAEAVARVLETPCVRGLAAGSAARQSGRGRRGRTANQGRFRVDDGTSPGARIGARLRALLRMVLRRHGCEPCAPDRWEGLDVLLVDDVRTTGTTSEELARLLLGRGARSVSLAVCAAADSPRRATLKPRVQRSR